jgi:hypothetical protein
MLFALRYILPAEWLALFGLLAYGLFILFDYPALIPSVHGGEILFLLGNTKNYGVILLVSIVVFVLVTFVRSLIRRESMHKYAYVEIVTFLRMLVNLIIAVYLMLCFKWWAHLHGSLYDEKYYAVDTYFGSLKHSFFVIDKWLKIPHEYYFQLFFYMFLAGYAICVSFNIRLFVRMVTANIAVALFGGMAYMIAPAYGPLFFEISTDPVIGHTQGLMLKVTQAFRDSGGTKFDPMFFEGVLGAMPSLHIAHATVIAVYSWRLNYINGLCFLALTSYIAIYAVVTRFHYIIDLQFGLLLAAFSIIITEKLYTIFDKQKISVLNQRNYSTM